LRLGIFSLFLCVENSVKSYKDWLLVVMGLALAGSLSFVAIELRKPRIEGEASVNAVELGRSYGLVVVATLGDAWNAAADTLAAGKTVAEAQTALQEKWKTGRTEAFNAKVVPTFVKVLPEATEPKDEAQRARVIELWRGFARGLKGARR
jgi:hypothetical protein